MIYTTQVTKADGVPRSLARTLDITVKSGHPAFAPTWDMVMGVKSGTLSETEYTIQYNALMRKSMEVNRKVWVEVLKQPAVAFMCYCGHNKFCHRHLLAARFIEFGLKEDVAVEIGDELI